MHCAHCYFTFHAGFYSPIIFLLIFIQQIPIQQKLIFIIQIGYYFCNFILHRIVIRSPYICKAQGNHRNRALQLSILLMLPYRETLKQFISVRILIREKTFHHTCVQSLAKPAGTCDQCHFIGIFPPFPDKVSFVHIKYMPASHFLKVLVPKSCSVLIHARPPFPSKKFL